MAEAALWSASIPAGHFGIQLMGLVRSSQVFWMTWEKEEITYITISGLEENVARKGLQRGPGDVSRTDAPEAGHHRKCRQGHGVDLVVGVVDVVAGVVENSGIFAEEELSSSHTGRYPSFIFLSSQYPTFPAYLFILFINSSTIDKSYSWWRIEKSLTMKYHSSEKKLMDAFLFSASVKRSTEW